MSLALVAVVSLISFVYTRIRDEKHMRSNRSAVEFTQDEKRMIDQVAARNVELFSLYKRKEEELSAALDDATRKKELLRIRQELWRKLDQTYLEVGIPAERAREYERQELVKLFGPRGGEFLDLKTKKDMDRWFTETKSLLSQNEIKGRTE